MSDEKSWDHRFVRSRDVPIDQPCSIRGCEEPSMHEFEYRCLSSRRTGRVHWRTRLLCHAHAAVFAEKHGIEWRTR